MNEGISYKKPGVGMAMVVAADAVAHVTAHLAAHGCESYPIGSIVKGDPGGHVPQRPAVVARWSRRGVNGGG